ncbi:MAG: hypothetical protein WCI12_08840 [Actinomycetes bacterium]|jgi:hypothetical protein
MSALVGALIVAVVLLGVVVIDLLRSHGRILRILHGAAPAEESLEAS